MQPVSQAIADYLIYLRIEQGATKATAKTYGPHLRHFLRWMQENGYSAPTLDDLSPLVVRRFLFTLAERNLRPMTTRNYLHALRGLAHYAVKTGLRADDFTNGVTMPKKDAPIRHTPTDEQVRALLEAVERDNNQRRTVQRRALLNVLIWSAMRRSELLNLKMQDVNLSERSLIIHQAKGGKSRLVYLPEPAVAALREWLALRGEVNHAYLWCADINRRLYFNGLRALLDDLRARAGLQNCDALKPHSLRHWRACDLLKAGATITTISAVLGHSDIKTTAVYLHSSEREARTAADLSCLNQPAQEQPKHEPAAERPALRIVSSRGEERPRSRRIAR